jgi:rubrerythrin
MGVYMKSLEGSKTLENLMKAFAGESQARNRYTYSASVANKEGYKQISRIFIETADNEKEHAKRFFKLALAGLEGKTPKMVDINATYPVVLGDTLENLKASAAGENEEWTELYPEFAKVADEEGYPEVAAAFKNIATAEKAHEARYAKLVANIENGEVFKKSSSIKWKCGNCGYVHEGTEAIDICPACLHPQAHFEVKESNY